MSDILASFAKINERIKNARANTGTGSLGWWPDEGEHVVDVLEITAVPADFEYKKAKDSKDRLKIPGVKIQTKLQLVDDPTNPHPEKGPRQCNGAPFIIPLDCTGLPDNQLKRVEIQEERLKGLFVTLLSVDDVPDTGAAIQMVANKIAEQKTKGTGLFVKCDFRYSDSDRKDASGKPKRTPDGEMYKELVAS